MTTIAIFGFAPSTFVQTVRLAALEKGVAHALKPLAFKAPEHFELHPFGKMPVMAHGDIRITESMAITVYIDAAFAGRKLRPEGTLPHARMWQNISVAASEAYPALVSAALGETPVDGETEARLLDFFDTQCRGQDAVTEEGPMLDDLFIFPILHFHAERAGRDVFATRERLASWYNEMKARPSFARAIGE